MKKFINSWFSIWCSIIEIILGGILFEIKEYTFLLILIPIMMIHFILYFIYAEGHGSLDIQ